MKNGSIIVTVLTEKQAHFWQQAFQFLRRKHISFHKIGKNIPNAFKDV